MTDKELSGQIIEAAIKVHTALGPGMLESVYEKVLAHELRQRDLTVETQVPITIRYSDLYLDDAFRADLIVADKIIIELKSVETVLPVHKKQLFTYLRLTNKQIGLLINFGDLLLRDGITRIVNGYTPD